MTTLNWKGSGASTGTTEGRVYIPVPINGNIPESAFEGCTAITSIGTRYSNVDFTCGKNAFKGCTNITSISNTHFKNIGEGAFEGCTSLASVTFANVTTIGDNAFKGCTALTTPSLASAESIGAGAFEGCTSLASVTFNNVTEVKTGAFRDCSKLETATFSNLTKINASSFRNCEELTSFNGTKVTTIGAYSFMNCTKLEEVSFPKITSISTQTFFSCTSLTTTYFPLVKNINQYAFYGCTSLSSISFPEATSIGNNAFYGCTSLSSISFPEATSIGNHAFYGCTSLENVNSNDDGSFSWSSFPIEVSVGDYAFYNCTSLKRIYLKASSIGERAFGFTTASNNSIEEIRLPTVTSIGANAFINIRSSGRIYIERNNYTTDIETDISNLSPAQKNKIVPYITLDEGNNAATDIGGYNEENLAVIFTRSIAKDKWSTICLPFNLTNTQIKAAFGDNVELAAMTGGDASTIRFESVTDTEANKPYAIKVDKDITEANTKTTVELNYVANPSETAGDWTFTGVYTPGNIPANAYFFSDNKLWRAADDTNTIKAFRGYFTNNSGAGSREMNFSVDDELTGIKTVGSGVQNVENEYFDLQGRKVAQPTKGLYIVNGKKIIVK